MSSEGHLHPIESRGAILPEATGTEECPVPQYLLPQHWAIVPEERPLAQARRRRRRRLLAIRRTWASRTGGPGCRGNRYRCEVRWWVRVQGLGFRVHGSGSLIQVQGSGFIEG